MKIKKFFALVFIGVLMILLLSSCWQVAAAKAAKKRTTQTGYVVGTIEDELEIDDPLHRKQRVIQQNKKNP